ncbi:hypothetical protein, partial [Coxiella-like endosymbiont]|uniref:hypothetical protein n=1 Tax=Coxiella-like endosymbiont TaxID=1592897 RepID=UPI0019D47AAB
SKKLYNYINKTSNKNSNATDKISNKNLLDIKGLIFLLRLIYKRVNSGIKTIIKNGFKNWVNFKIILHLRK